MPYFLDIPATWQTHDGGGGGISAFQCFFYNQAKQDEKWAEMVDGLRQ